MVFRPDIDPDHPHHAIEHYYGDVIRVFLVIAAAVMLIGQPFYASNLRAELPFTLLGAVTLFALAALMNPHNKSIVGLSAAASGIGLVIYEAWALFQYNTGTWLQFGLRELVAVLFMVAFYFSLKTMRAMMLHTIGKHDQVGEFDTLKEEEKDTM